MWTGQSILCLRVGVVGDIWDQSLLAAQVRTRGLRGPFEESLPWSLYVEAVLHLPLDHWATRREAVGEYSLLEAVALRAHPLEPRRWRFVNTAHASPAETDSGRLADKSCLVVRSRLVLEEVRGQQQHRFPALVDQRRA